MASQRKQPPATNGRDGPAFQRHYAAAKRAHPDDDNKAFKLMFEGLCMGHDQYRLS